MWLITAMLLLKAAVPVLASVAADRQGVALAEVCSVYGIRTVMVDAVTSDTGEAPLPGQHAEDIHCPLASLLLGAALDMPASVVSMRASGRVAARLPAPPEEPPADASRRWLALRLHSPPVPV